MKDIIGSRLFSLFLKILPSLLLFYPMPTLAHVKWFAPYNLQEAPLDISNVLTQKFFVFLLAFSLLVFLFFLMDRAILYRHKFDMINTWTSHLHRYTEPLLRISSAIFFVCIAYLGNIILTPELTTNQSMIPAIQLFIVFPLMSKKTLPITGFGILYLYTYGLIHYGLFHILDYIIFVGLALYFILSSKESEEYLDKSLHLNRMTILYLTTAFTVMWASIEKFGYAKWSYVLLDKYPEITFGIPFDDYMLLAAFVEYSLIFVLITGTYFARLVSFGFLSIFIIAIFKFGMIDAIGHLMIMAILLAMSIQGPTKARAFVLFGKQHPVYESLLLVILYIVTLFSFFILYYGLHYLQYKWLPGLDLSL